MWWSLLLSFCKSQRGKDLDKAERYAQTALKQNGTLRPYVLDTLDQIANARGNVAMKL
jgi:hypothetical protein